MEQTISKTTYVIKVAITGPEASGKSQLTIKLAKHYGTSFAPEFARRYLEKTKGTYEFQDLDQITLGQLENENRALSKADKICFFDTDMLVMHVWASFRFGKVSPLIQKSLNNRVYDFWLLCKPDLPWEADPLRESPDQKEREALFDIYQQYLTKNHPNQFAIIQGGGKDRMKGALQALEGLT